MSDKVKAKPEQIFPPWTERQVRALNRWQHRGEVHPFTCGLNSEHVLVATSRGWHCIHDDYTQKWAWSCMAAPFRRNRSRGSGLTVKKINKPTPRALLRKADQLARSVERVWQRMDMEYVMDGSLASRIARAGRIAREYEEMRAR